MFAQQGFTEAPTIFLFSSWLNGNRSELRFPIIWLLFPKLGKHIEKGLNQHVSCILCCVLPRGCADWMLFWCLAIHPLVGEYCLLREDSTPDFLIFPTCLGGSLVYLHGLRRWIYGGSH